MAIRVTGINSGMDTDAMVQELVSAYKTKGEKTEKEKTKLEWKQEVWKDLNKKIQSFSKKLQNLKYSDAYNIKKTTSSNESKVSVVAGDSAPNGTQTVQVKQLAQATYITSGEIKRTDGGKVTGSTKLSELGLNTDGNKIILNKNGGGKVEISANQDTTVNDIVKNLKSAGVDANFDESTGRIFVNAKETGYANGFTLTQEGGGDVLEKLHLRTFGGNGADQGASIVSAQDAIIDLNGATFKSATNTFNVNGLSITAKEVTGENEKISITTELDTDGIYNQIKGILKDYSELINELDKLYNADSAKDYEPLTDDEKDSMSETEIEKWEQKIKDSLLRRDSTVSSISSAMKQSSLMCFKVNGKTMTLADFGIGTLGYFKAEDNERNALHIDGDEDDEAVSTETNKLKKMIAEDPSAVTSFFTSFISELSDKFTSLSSSTSDRTYGTFYNDKKVKSDLEKYEKKISDWEEYVNDIEDKYYKQFSNMETQLAKLNSTQTSLSNYFS